MSREALAKLRTEELVERYRAAAIVYGESEETKVANKASKEIANVYRELRKRGLGAQSALLPLIFESAPAVRLWAAAHALEFAPAEGEAVLTKLGATSGPHAFSARMTLEVWRKGELRFS